VSIIKQVHIAIRRSALVAIAVLVGSIAFAAPSHAQSSVLEPTVLTVHDIEDWWPDNTDEISVVYGGQNWGESISNGGSSTRPFHPATFTDSIRIDIYEHDGSYPTHLGTRFAYPGTTSLTWGGPGSAFHYTLQFKPPPVSSTPLSVRVHCAEEAEYYMECDAAPSGGTTPYRVYTWFVNGVQRARGSSAWFGADCAGGTYVEVRVTDAAGMSATGRASVYCDDFVD
jgi:hypothetical protein